MLSKKNTRRHVEEVPAETTESGIEMVFSEEEFGCDGLAGSCSHREADYVEPDQASKFMKGLIFALPLSISLWAGMILGLKALF